ncbi:MAG TPA: 4-(cytidine 5'-diphospho)-2-C-methyl-D-erythritol kinase [Deltaproteobacteria bacterium]|nr:4-(cytidine 5'-diphospho)-2-C-methyl-D-erythritol kinase [Deltaproteobacteria bacterium]HQB38161.1 4-(cytidine 5'-diphospho)-2-C-methyl-D-erythritol kinase [Deltaproteobacteria bacterium]
MKTITLQAPAKVNYLLDVIGRRPDGYHELRMVMQRVGLCDEITITLNDDDQLTVTCGIKGVPDGPGNIAWKAARAILDLAGSKQGAAITINKRIPSAAGLGGGSSDAASVLMGMNELLELKLSDQQMMDIGVTLGADVPFFIFKQTALAEGIGEKLSAMPPMPRLWVLLVNPGVHVSTGWVYNNLQLTNRSGLARLPELFSSIDDVCAMLSNDLESVTIPAFPVIDEIKQRMLMLGAVASMMSGSGPTVFGLFRDKTTAESACEAITQDTGWFAAAVQTL